MTTTTKFSSMITLLFALVLASSLSACVVDAGTDSPGPIVIDEDSAYPTTFDVAVDLSLALCDQLVDCGDILSFEHEECTELVVDKFCSRVPCESTPRSSDGEIFECLDAIDAQPCAFSDELPEECVGLI